MTQATLAGRSIALASPDVGAEELRAIGDVLGSGILTNGPATRAFEDAFATLHDVQHAVAFANGTVALAAMYIALGIGPGDEIVVPSLTFISSATSVLHVGATPIFADVAPEDFNIDPADVTRRLTPRTKAILAVHYGGHPAPMEPLRELAEARDLVLLEDAAEAHGATYRGRHVGGLATAAMFSFTPTKNITTGEGGMVTTNDPDLAYSLRLLRNHGQESSYHHTRLGHNWRISEMQAAMGSVQLTKLPAILKRKRRNARIMETLLSRTPQVTCPAALHDREHVYMLYTLKVERRDGLLRHLLSKGIEARIYFPPAHLQPIFSSKPSELPNTERLANMILSLPFHSRLTEADLYYIADAITSFYGTETHVPMSGASRVARQ